MPDDFAVGCDISIYGRVVRIYDCDEYTRAFFEVSTCFRAQKTVAVATLMSKACCSLVTLKVSLTVSHELWYDSLILL